MEGNSINLGLTNLAGSEQRDIVAAVASQDCMRALEWLEDQLTKSLIGKRLLGEYAVGLPVRFAADFVQDVPRTRLLAVCEQLGVKPEWNATSANQPAPQEVGAAQSALVLAKPFGSSLEEGGLNMSPEWEHFSRLVKTVSGKSESLGATTHRASSLSAWISRPLMIGLSLALLCISICFFVLREKTPIKGLRFIRVAKDLSLAVKGDLNLEYPRLQALEGIGALSSLVYEINATPVGKKIFASSSSRNIPSDAAIVASPVGAVVKETLQIGIANEPADVRKADDVPEVAIPENVIDFPPYVHGKKAGQAETPAATPTLTGEVVERFNPLRAYIITAATQELASPSYWAPRIGAYDPGDTVHVEAKIGVWLRLRDHLGRPRYILAQDASPQ